MFNYDDQLEENNLQILYEELIEAQSYKPRYDHLLHFDELLKETKRVTTMFEVLGYDDVHFKTVIRFTDPFINMFMQSAFNSLLED